MKTFKPPAGLIKAPFVIEQGLCFEQLTEKKLLFSGSVRNAAEKFPANVNVAVALGLAGIGVDLTQYEIWVDPKINRNIHSISVEADSTRFEMNIEGVPTKENPATGMVTPLSVIAALESLVSPLRIGS